MKNILLLVALVSAMLLHSGCLSAWVDRASARGREVLQGGSTVAAITAHFGAPERDAPDWVNRRAERDAYRGETWTIWKIRGRPARVDDGGGQATVSALTLGAGEVILLPMTLVGAGADALKNYYLVGIFGPDGKLRRHLALEAGAQRGDVGR